MVRVLVGDRKKVEKEFVLVVIPKTIEELNKLSDELTRRGFKVVGELRDIEERDG